MDAEGQSGQLPFFRDYPDGNKPFLVHQYFQLHYIKQAIKHLLRRS